MDLNEVKQNLQTQYENKVKQIQQLQQQLDKANTEALKLQGAWELTNELVNADKKVEADNNVKIEAPIVDAE